MEHQSESDDRSDYEDDSSVMFNIPEETMEAARDSGSESGYLDGSDDNDSSLGLDDLDDQAYMDPLILVVITIFQMWSYSFKNSCCEDIRFPLQPTLSGEENIVPPSLSCMDRVSWHCQSIYCSCKGTDEQHTG
jgi:hypothetical protein